MARLLSYLGIRYIFLLTGLIGVALLPAAGFAAQASDPAFGKGTQMPVPSQPGSNPEELIKYFDGLSKSQKLPPEAAGLFQGMRGIMEGAAQGQDPRSLREKSGALFRGMQPLMEKPDLPPEAVKIFKSFESLTQPGTAPPKPQEFLQQFEKLMQNKQLPPEAAGLFQGMRGIMEGAAQGQDPQSLREKSGALFRGMQPMMEKPDLPPEAAEMFRTFQGMLPPPATDRPVN